MIVSSVFTYSYRGSGDGGKGIGSVQFPHVHSGTLNPIVASKRALPHSDSRSASRSPKVGKIKNKTTATAAMSATTVSLRFTQPSPQTFL
jgi:hypothetical protein